MSDYAERTDADDFMEVMPTLDGEPMYWECIWCGQTCVGHEPWNTTHKHCYDKPSYDEL